MSVDYSQCDACGFGYRDDSEHVCYCDCGSHFCRYDCGKLGNYFSPYNPHFAPQAAQIDEKDPLYEDWENGVFCIDKNKPITCVVCRKEQENDEVLFYAILKHYGISRQDAIKIWKKQKE